MGRVMRGEAQDSFLKQNPEALKWSYGTDVHSPYVLNQGNKIKQESVELVRRWYGRRNVMIRPGDVYFFGDRTENIEPFEDKGFNSREISCGSRGKKSYSGTGMIGFCGALPEEIKK